MTPEEEMKQLLEVIVAQQVSHQARALQIRALADHYGKDCVIDALMEKLSEWQEAYVARFSPPAPVMRCPDPFGHHEQE